MRVEYDHIVKPYGCLQSTFLVRSITTIIVGFFLEMMAVVTVPMVTVGKIQHFNKKCCTQQCHQLCTGQNTQVIKKKKVIQPESQHKL